MKNLVKKALFAAVLASSLLLAGCSSNIGVGMSVGVPIGDHGYISVGGGSNRWY
jgi:predicted small secreted protein